MIITFIKFIIDFYRTFLSFDRGVLAAFAPGGACRNNPSCSLYTRQKIEEFGVVKGIGLGLVRIWRCR